MPAGFQAFGNAEGYVGSTPFTPPLISGLVLWLDAGATGGVDGNNLTSWTDLSSNGFTLNAQDGVNVFHATGGPNNLPYVTFAAGPLYRASPLISAADGARTCFTIVKRTSDAHVCWLDGRFGFNGFALSFGAAVSNKREIYVSGIAVQYDTTSNATSNWEKICIINAGLGAVSGNQRMRVDGSAHTLSASNAVEGAATVRFSLGGNDQVFAPDDFDGSVAELIVYDSLLSDDDIARVESYLLTKYGI